MINPDQDNLNLDELIVEFTKELCSYGVYFGPEAQSKMREQLASSENPSEVYQKIRNQSLQSLNEGLKEEAIVGFIGKIFLGFTLLTIICLISQCSSFVYSHTTPTSQPSLNNPTSYQ